MPLKGGCSLTHAFKYPWLSWLKFACSWSSLLMGTGWWREKQGERSWGAHLLHSSITKQRMKKATHFIDTARTIASVKLMTQSPFGKLITHDVECWTRRMYCDNRDWGLKNLLHDMCNWSNYSRPATDDRDNPIAVALDITARIPAATRTFSKMVQLFVALWFVTPESASILSKFFDEARWLAPQRPAWHVRLVY